MHTGSFVVSLDFELNWGVHDSKKLSGYGEYLLGVHQVIPRLLDLFERYQISATFAIVGFLFYANKKELMKAWPQRRPDYHNSRFSTYHHHFSDDAYHFGLPLIQEIKSRARHEIASHTFSHYYCAEPGQTLEDFRTDLQWSQRAAAEHQLNLRSIVFPRNQIRPEYVALCREEGFLCYRGNQTSWLYRTSNRSKIGRLLRLADNFVNLSGHNLQRARTENQLVNLPASAFLRALSPQTPGILRKLQLQRIVQALRQASRQRAIYHLWWHPHNFGKHIQMNLDFLEEILIEVTSSGLKSQTMAEAAACA